jgi:RHS repeat-associated protein
MPPSAKPTPKPELRSGRSPAQNQDTIPGSTTGLHDFLFREYAQYGRWISPDPAGVAPVDISNPQSWNRYAYVLNNPTGLCSLELFRCAAGGSEPEQYRGLHPDATDTGGHCRQIGIIDFISPILQECC